MKYAIVESIAATPHIETSGEIALRLKDNKKKVIFYWAGYNLMWNEWQLNTLKKFLGGSYEQKVKKFIELLEEKNIEIERENFDIDDFKIYSWAKNFNGNLSQLKKYKYENANLGVSVASSIISYYQNTEIDLKKNFLKVQDLLYSSCLVYERTKKFILKNKPKKIFTFNNRFATSYPIICAAEKFNVDIIRHERGSTIKKFELYKNNVHDLDYIKKQISYYWKINKSKSRERKAKKYFINKFNKKIIKNDQYIVFSKDQIKNYLPDLPKDKRIVSFFTSRDYEKASIINMNFDQIKVFKEFKSVIYKINDVHLVVRVHPDPTNKTKDDEEWLKYSDKNTTIIKSNQKFDSYALINKSDIVTSYTSSIIVESAFIGKPSISLGNFWWSNQKILEEPKSFSELKKMLSKDYFFKKRSKKGCLKIANYFLNYGIKYKYYNPINATNGLFLGKYLTWKSKFIIFLEKFNFFRIIK